MATDKTMRHPVAQGGMWNTAKPQYSKETQSLLKEMMKESKLTNFQQRQLGKAMNEGEALPKKCNPTSSAKQRVVSPPTKPDSIVIDPRKYNPTVRTQDKIEAAGAYHREKFAPSPQIKYGGFYEKDKTRLANIMAYGEDLPPPDRQKVLRRPVELPPVDRFEELEAEINERRSFLADMEKRGMGDKYRTIINTETSRLLREMEVIDRQRTGLLEKAIAEERKQYETKYGIPKPPIPADEDS